MMLLSPLTDTLLCAKNIVWPVAAAGFVAACQRNECGELSQCRGSVVKDASPTTPANGGTAIKQCPNNRGNNNGAHIQELFARSFRCKHEFGGTDSAIG